MKLLWHINIQTYHAIGHRRPDIVVVEKDNGMTLFIDNTVPGDTRVEDKEQILGSGMRTEEEGFGK